MGGVPKACPDGEFIELIEKYGPTRTSQILGVTRKNVHRRRRNIERLQHTKIDVPNTKGMWSKGEEHPARVHLEVKDGIVLIGSDSHYWPGIVSTAHRAFLKFCKKLAPVVVIKNGDEIDGATISRHAPIGWEHRPSLIEEIEAASDRLDEVFKASANAKHIWPLGNHDARFSTRLATIAPEYARVKGVQLKDHFPGWQPCWSVWINESVVIKHRFKSGLHAPHNNTMWSGKTMVTGHLHSLKVMPLSDYNGTRWGVDCGTMADPYGPQFVNYTEDNPLNWRSGFAVLTFKNGELLDPETVRVRDEDSVIFRGEVIKV
jgi:hypothetical protein